LTTGNDTDKRLTNLEDAIGKLIDIVSQQGKVVETVKAGTTTKKRLFGEHSARVAILDTKTGITYPSKAAVTKAMGLEFGVDPGDHFGCYKIFAKAPGRFTELAGDAAQKAWDAADSANKAIVDAANAKLAAEKKAAEDAAAKKVAEDAALEAAKQKAAQGKSGKK